MAQQPPRLQPHLAWSREFHLLIFRTLVIRFLARSLVAAAPATVDIAFASPSTPTQGQLFDIEVSGSAFDKRNDKVMIISSPGDCGLDDPPKGNPYTIAEYNLKSCAGPGSAPTVLKCSGFTVYQPGFYQMCVCDSTGNDTELFTRRYSNTSAEWIRAITLGCDSKERYVLGGKDAGVFFVNGPEYSGPLAWNEGALNTVTLRGTQMIRQEQIRIVNESTSCMDPNARKTMDPAVRPLTIGARDIASGEFVSIWKLISIMKIGTYQVCWCGNTVTGCANDADFGVWAATIVVSGPVPNGSPLPCITGVRCTLDISGVGLTDLGRIRIVSNFITCGTSGAGQMNNAIIQGGVGPRTSGDSTTSFFGGIISSRSGDFSVCWCGRQTTPGCTDCCVQDWDFNIFVRNITIRGVQQGVIYSPKVGVPSSYVMTGWGMSDVDRISIIDGDKFCGVDGAQVMSKGIWAFTAPYGPPTATEGPSPQNRTTIIWAEVVISAMQQYRVCWCARFYGSCQLGSQYALDVGMILPQGPLNSTMINAVPGRPFQLRVDAQPGSQLMAADRYRIVLPSVIQYRCGLSGSSVHSSAVAKQSCWPTCGPTNIMDGPTVYQGGAYEIWDPLLLLDRGTFWICWCNGARGSCNTDGDFNVQVGAIISNGVSAGSVWDCAAYMDCRISIKKEGGASSKDVVQLISTAYGSACGISPRVSTAQFNSGSRVGCYENAVWQGNVSVQMLIFSFGSPLVPGFFQVCYCQSQGKCETDLDFFQSVGVIRISGLSGTTNRYVCYLNTGCSIPIQGSGLSNTDAIMIINSQDACGLGVDATAASFVGQGFLGIDSTYVFVGTLTGTSDTGMELWQFKFGNPLRVGSYSLCYCTAKMAVNGVCTGKSNFKQNAGQIVIRGAAAMVNQYCTQGDPCQVLVRGQVMDYQDRLLLVRSNFSCTDDVNGSYGTWTLPMTPRAVSPDDLLPGMMQAVFNYPNIWEPGTYHVCYCANVAGAASCLAPTTLDPLRPNFNRFYDVGKLIADGAILGVQPVTQGQDGLFLSPLPATPYAASVSIVASQSGFRLTCVAFLDKAPFIPQKSDLQNCTLPVSEQTERQKIMPRCIGVGRSLNPTDQGANLVHIPLTLPEGTNILEAKVHTFCYPSVMCSNDKCVMPASPAGLVQSFTSGPVAGQSWTATAATPFTVAVALGVDFDIDPSWTSMKLIDSGADIVQQRRLQTNGSRCDQQMLARSVSGLTCVDAPMGACSPHPTKMISSGSWGSNRQLGWRNISIARPGQLTVCYCDRLDDQGCAVWVDLGFVKATGPYGVGLTSYVANPGVPFDLVIRGEGLANGDRVRILPPNVLCTSDGFAVIGPTSTVVPAMTAAATSSTKALTTTTGAAGGGLSTTSGIAGNTRRLQQAWASGNPTFANDSFESWNMQVDLEGVYQVCWCGSGTRSCQLPVDFTVRVGSLTVVPKRDCDLTDWWVLTPCNADCGGGTIQYRRSVRAQPQGGGKECPGPEGLVKSEQCAMEPCPLARIDGYSTDPKSIAAQQVFKLSLYGSWMDPSADRVLLIGENQRCGDPTTQGSHFGGAACDDPTSTTDTMHCGNGVSSMYIEQPGRYRICYCDASSVVTRSIDGTINISIGSFSAAGRLPSGCADAAYYVLEPQALSIIEIGAALVKDEVAASPETAAATSAFSQQAAKDVQTWLAPVLVTVAVCILLCIGCCVGFYLWRRWLKQREITQVKEIEEEIEAARREAVERTFNNAVNSYVPAGPDPATIAWYENYYRSLGYPPGSAARALAGIPLGPPGQGEVLQLGDGMMGFPDPPPVGHNPMLPMLMPPSIHPRAPPPPTPPLHALPGATPSSPISAGVSPRVGRSSSNLAFGDLVKAAEKRSNTGGNFLKMDLTPLPTPTCTPRGETPRALAIEDGSASERSSLPPPTTALNVGALESALRTAANALEEKPAATEEAPAPVRRPDSSQERLRPGTSDTQGTFLSDDRASLALSESSAGGDSEEHEAPKEVAAPKALATAPLPAAAAAAAANPAPAEPVQPAAQLVSPTPIPSAPPKAISLGGVQAPSAPEVRNTLDRPADNKKASKGAPPPPPPPPPVKASAKAPGELAPPVPPVAKRAPPVPPSPRTPRKDLLPPSSEDQPPPLKETLQEPPKAVEPPIDEPPTPPAKSPRSLGGLAASLKFQREGHGDVGKHQRATSDGTDANPVTPSRSLKGLAASLNFKRPETGDVTKTDRTNDVPEPAAPGEPSSLSKSSDIGEPTATVESASLPKPMGAPNPASPFPLDALETTGFFGGPLFQGAAGPSSPAASPPPPPPSKSLQGLAESGDGNVDAQYGRLLQRPGGLPPPPPGGRAGPATPSKSLRGLAQSLQHNSSERDDSFDGEMSNGSMLAGMSNGSILGGLSGLLERPGHMRPPPPGDREGMPIPAKSLRGLAQSLQKPGSPLNDVADAPPPPPTSGRDSPGPEFDDMDLEDAPTHQGTSPDRGSLSVQSPVGRPPPKRSLAGLAKSSLAGLKEPPTEAHRKPNSPAKSRSTTPNTTPRGLPVRLDDPPPPPPLPVGAASFRPGSPGFR